jgi:periplasmic protein TonB
MVKTFLNRLVKAAKMKSYLMVLLLVFNMLTLQSREGVDPEEVKSSIRIIGPPNEEGLYDIAIECYTDIDKPPKEEIIYTVVQYEPSFPGGMKALHRYLRESIIYPEEAKKDSFQGRLIVTFILEKDGSLSNVHIRERFNLDPLLNQEALRVVKEMPDWEPGRQQGEEVRVKRNLPIRFRLD